MTKLRLFFVVSVVVCIASLASAQVPINLQVPPKTVDELNQMPLSGVLYGKLLERLTGTTISIAARHHATTGIAGEPTRHHGLTPGVERVPGAIAPNESVLSTTNIDSDTNMDIEPSVIKQTNSSGSASIVVHTKYAGSPLEPLNYYYSDASGGPYTGQFGLPTGYTWSGDPFLAESQSDSTLSVHPRRVYTCGLVGNNTSTVGIAVWYSDNLGQSWTLSSNLVNSSTSSSVDLDKPTCDVSQYSSSLGNLYVAYMRQDGTTTPTTYEIHCARSTDGGASFDQDVVVYSSNHFLNMADVVVSGTNGYIYVLWADFTANPQQIYLARSATSGSLSGTWTVDSGGPTGYFFTTTTDYLHGNVRAVTVPMARYNWSATKISVVWHEKEASGSHLADVYYAAKGTGGWQSKVKISNESSNPNCTAHTDQFMPALDYDSSGNLIVTYYDRQGDCLNNSNSLYDLYYTKIDSTGSSLQSPTRASTFQSDPSRNTFTGINNTTYSFIGDYQGLWSDDNSPVIWHSAWIGAPANGSSDTYHTQIQ
jgi:hypothetical protein